MELWSASTAWLRRHTSADLAYRVRLRISPDEAADEVWRLLTDEHTTDGDAVLDGGAALRRVGPDMIVVVSGGEDALDSLSWSINETLREALRRVGASAEVVDQSRVLERD